MRCFNLKYVFMKFDKITASNDNFIKLTSFVNAFMSCLLPYAIVGVAFFGLYKFTIS